ITKQLGGFGHEFSGYRTIYVFFFFPIVLQLERNNNDVLKTKTYLGKKIGIDGQHKSCRKYSAISKIKTKSFALVLSINNPYSLYLLSIITCPCVFSQWLGIVVDDQS
ncbi:hypothetical protein ACJX0J_012475, partial [Zea mays]